MAIAEKQYGSYKKNKQEDNIAIKQSASPVSKSYGRIYLSELKDYA